METLTLNPIGYLRSRDELKFAVPHQPQGGAQKNHLIELSGGHNFESALRDLEGFERIWLIWWFHKNTTWRPCVLPPRGQARRRGVFSTRSPHRPNPLGMSCVELLKIKGRTLLIGDTDLIDGTPILDIKPYIPAIDSFPDASSGWLKEIEHKYASPALYKIELEPLACSQLEWLKEIWNIDFITQAKKLLSIDPTPHRTRRIISLTPGVFRMGCGAWRVFFALQGQNVIITQIAAGYPDKALRDPNLSNIADRNAQLEFNQLWK